MGEGEKRICSYGTKRGNGEAVKRGRRTSKLVIARSTEADEGDVAISGKIVLVKAIKALTQRTQRRPAGRPHVPQGYTEEFKSRGKHY